MTSSPRTYWRSLEELADTEAFADFVEREAPRFREIVGLFDRRRFLQLMAASMALGGLSGCGPEVRPRQLLPYVREPENVIPGQDRYYASALTQGAYATGVLVAHQMARPIKVEGNPDHPASLGAAGPITQASILELYDPRRAQTLYGDGRITVWERFVAVLNQRRAALSANKGAGLRILTAPTSSPLLQSQLAQLKSQYPAMRWGAWEPAHRDNELAAAKLSFGRPVDRIFDVGAAKRILGVGSDLISSAPGWLAYARAFAAARRPAETGGSMSRVYAIESTPTLLGAKADHRLPLAPDETVASLRYLAARLAGGPQEWSQQQVARADWLDAAADDLKQHQGAALVHAGREQPVEVHALVDAINNALGGFGATVRVIDPVEVEAGAKQDFLSELTEEMAAGKVDTLLILGANPVYDAPADIPFAKALAKIPFSVCLSLYEDETSSACNWRIPAAHDYEAWGDARAFDGTVTILQPQVRPLYGGHSAQQILAVLLGNPNTDEYSLTREFWRGAKRGAADDFDSFWRAAVQKGVVPDTTATPLDLKPQADLTALPTPASAAGSTRLQALFRPDELSWDGRYADNPWLLEAPRAFTRLTWDNAAQFSPATAKRLGLSNEDVVEIAIGGRKLKAPAFVLPGQAENCVTLPLGWGRTKGGLGVGAGFDAYRLRTKSDPWTAAISSIAKTNDKQALATTQSQDHVEGRDLIQEGTLDQFQHDPGSITSKGKSQSLYAPYPYPGRAWAMSVDLNSCIGCQACVIACQAENNVPIVGKDQVLDERVMHWLRIDRYYSGEADDPRIDFEPMPCMHCEDAPCEVVCPVHATVHDHEGLNLMVYNRCVGTRFCSNNCPYKVRRFNFFGFAERNDRPPESWNPEVTVRGRGVMEKCTYCIQRIRTTEIVADRDNRPIRDGEIRTACQQSCPTQAIIFGDRNNPESEVVKRKHTPIDYALLDDLNTRPRTTYTAAIRNPNPAIKVKT